MEDFPPIIAGIVRDCLQFEPASRPTANDVAERLVQWQFRDADLNRDEHGNTLLHQLVAECDDEGIRHLLDSQKAVMVNAVNNFGETPLMIRSVVATFFVDDLLQYRKVPPSNEEPSRVAEYFHNFDVFGNLMRLAEKQNVDRIGNIGSAKSFQNMDLSERGDSNGETPLHIAARLGNAALFDALLDLQAFNEWKPNNDGRTALHVASLHGHADIMKTLLALTESPEVKGEAGPHKVNIQDKMGKTALHVAARSGNISALRVLLDCSVINVNLRDLDKRPPMFDITLAENTDASTRAELLQAFVRHPDIDPNAKDSAGETMLHKVARYDLAESSEVLLQLSSTDMFVRDEEHKYAPIHLSVREKSFRVAAILLSKLDANVNERDKYGNTLLHLLAASLYPNDATDEAILIYVSFTENLVSRDDVDLNLFNSHGKTPLHIAIKQNNLTVVEAMLSAPAGKLRINQLPESKGKTTPCTPLCLAVLLGRTDMAKLILSRSDVDVCAADERLQQTPLHWASRNNDAEVAKMLLSRDEVDVNARNSCGNTPLHLASNENATEVAKMLLSRDDVDATARNDIQETPLHNIAWKNGAEITTMLLSKKEVDINARDRDENTPLHVACYWNASEVVKILLSRKDVDVGARQRFGWTPLYAAMSKSKKECEALLREVDVNTQW